MPTITISLSDLSRLVGVDLRDKFSEVTEYMKVEVNSITGDLAELEVTHDRPDYFSAEGIARSVKGILGVEVGLPKLTIEEDYGLLKIGNVPQRPIIRMALVEDVEIDEEAVRQLVQLQEKLHMTYGRDRAKFAIGLYDADKVKFPLSYVNMPIDEVKYEPMDVGRVVTGRELLTMVDKGVRYGKYALWNGMVPVLIDSSNVIHVVIPVLGSEYSRLTKGTRRVLIDVTGIDDAAVENALKVMAFAVAERSRSRVVKVLTPGSRSILEPRAIRVKVSDINGILGVDLSREQVVDLLLRARYGVEVDGGELIVQVPPYRFLVIGPSDIAEDVAVAYGYNKLPRVYPTSRSMGRLMPLTKFTDMLANVLVTLGLQEVANYVLTSRSLMEAAGVEYYVDVLNPVSEKFNVVRSSIWPQLLNVISQNRHLLPGRIKIFEVGRVVRGGDVLREEPLLAIAVSGPRVTLTDVLVVLNTLIAKLGAKPTYRHTNAKPYGIEGRFVEILVNGNSVGIAFEVNPQVLINLGIDYPASVCEVNIRALWDSIHSIG